MGSKRFLLLITSFALIILTSSCNLANSVNQIPPAPTTDIQATVDAAIQSTALSHKELQEAIESGVIATLTALPPIPSATPVASSELSEEQLAIAVDSSVDDAEAASEQCSAAVSEVTSDGTVTEEEVIYVSYYVDYAEDEIDQALALADEYLALYGELAEESIEVMNAIEEDLSAMAENTEAISQTLEEINSNLAQGVELAEETISQLNEQAQEIGVNSQALQEQSQEMVTQIKSEIQARGESKSNMPPNQSAMDLKSALSLTKEYMSSIKNSMTDGKLTGLELDTIAQLGANASAGLEMFGGSQFQGFASSIPDITNKFARGELPQAQLSFANFESSLPSFPGLRD